jgi:hypothetical protein
MIVNCSRGSREILPGMKWRDPLTGSTWEVVEPSGERIYSPSSFGGAPCFWCRPVGDELPAAAQAWLKDARADGCISFCGDSIAASLLEAEGAHQ